MKSYLELIYSFWQMDACKTFSCIDTRVYFYILSQFNMQHWKDTLESSNIKMASNIGISENAFKESRNRLRMAGLIDFEIAKTRAQATKYWIKDTVSPSVSNDDTIKEDTVSPSVSNDDTQNDEKTITVSRWVSPSVSNDDTLKKKKNKNNLKEKNNKKENGGVGLKAQPENFFPTPTPTKVVLDFYNWIREHIPYCANNMTLPSMEQIAWLNEHYLEKDVKKRLLRIENNIKVRNNTAVLFTKLRDWLEEDAEIGKIKTRAQVEAEKKEAQLGRAGNGGTDQPMTAESGGEKRANKKTDEDVAQRRYIEMLTKEAKKGNASAVSELSKMNIIWQ